MDSHLRLVVSTRLHAALDITNLLQHPPRVFQVLREPILLLRNLRQQHPELVTDVAHGVILGALAPVTQLRRDALRLAAGRLVGADGMVFGLDQLVEALRKLGLLHAAQAAHGEAVLGRSFVAAFALLRADGEGAVPGAVVVSMACLVACRVLDVIVCSHVDGCTVELAILCERVSTSVLSSVLNGKVE